MRNSSRNLRHAVHITLAAVTSAAGTQLAYGQVAPAAAADPTLNEIVVTGSRLLQSPNEISISPVTSITAGDIQQTGLVRVEDLLNNLPQVIAENGSGQSISSNGTATVSLRGLGSQRTLVLVNGHRMNPGAGLGTSSAADINQIPAGLIERADVLTGGASAVYGADAVAGVVNFVLNTHFEGVKVDANYGFGQHKNDNQDLINLLKAKNDQLPPGTTNAGQNRDVSVLMGSSFADGKGHATAYLTYLNSSPAVGYQYDFAGCTLNTPGTKAGLTTKKYSCGGSSSSATGRFLLLGSSPTPHGKSVLTTLADRTVDAQTGAFRPYSSSKDSYNYGALSYLQRQAERFTAGSFVNYEINEHANVYSEFMFARNTSQAAYGPSGLFAFGTPSISCSNPLLTADQKATLCNPTAVAQNQKAFGGTGDRITLYAARRSVESGPRQDNYSSNSFRELAGVKGRLNDVWSYDLYGQVGITQMELKEGNFLGVNQINNSLDVITDPKTGKPACAAAVAGYDKACVPWNIWAPGGVTQAALDYLRVQSSYGIVAKEYIVDGSLTADLGKYGLKLPTAASGLQANFGAEYRQEKYDFEPDYIFANGLESGGNGSFSAIHGGFHVAEVFTEMHLPLVDEKPWAQSLAVEGGYRYSNYTSGFSTNTFKLGLEWAPIRDVRTRASYNRAIRAPNIGDLYTPQVVGSGGTADPCWGASPTYTQAQCANTGVSASQYGHILPNPAAQINTTAGGNPKLTPEVADTYSLGFVFQPSIVPNLVMSLDYYDIKIKNTIESLTSNTVLANCANTADPATCGLIHRGAGTGSLWFNVNDYINTNEVNIGTVSTKGVDLTASYRYDLGAYGKLGFNLTGTRVQNFLTQPLLTGGSYDCTGYFGSTCGSPTPKWRHALTTNWATPWGGLDATLKWRYIGSVAVDRSSSDPQLAADYYPGTSKIGAYNYFDVSFSAPIGNVLSLRVGVNNIADKAPPIVLNGNYSDCPNLTCNDNTFVGTYDTLGRYIYAHVSAKF